MASSCTGLRERRTWGYQNSGKYLQLVQFILCFQNGCLTCYPCYTKCLYYYLFLIKFLLFYFKKKRRKSEFKLCIIFRLYCMHLPASERKNERKQRGKKDQTLRCFAEPNEDVGNCEKETDIKNK